MTTQEVLEDFSLPLNPVQLTCSKMETPTLNTWPMDHNLLLVTMVHSYCNSPYEKSDPEPNWEEISRKLSPGYRSGGEQKTGEFFSSTDCKRQYNYLMSTVGSGVEDDGKLRKSSINEKREVLIKNIAEKTVRISEKRDKELRKEIDKIGKRILFITSGGLDNILSEISDSGETDSETEELDEMAHPFEDSDSFLEQLKRAFNLTEESLLSPPVASNIAVSVDPSLVQNSEILRSSSPPTYSTMEFKKGSASGQAVSPQLKNLVHSAIAGAAQEDKTKNVSPTSAPTLSMLLEMPPRDRGQPLPQIQSLMGSTNSPSVDSLTNIMSQSSSSPIKQESPNKVVTPVGTTLSPVKTIAQNSGRRDGVGLPGFTLSMPLKTQEEIEIANDFVISSGLVQEVVTETYVLGQNLPSQEIGFQAQMASGVAIPDEESNVGEGGNTLELPEDCFEEMVLTEREAQLPFKKTTEADISMMGSSPDKIPTEVSELPGVKDMDTSVSHDNEVSEKSCTTDHLKPSIAPDPALPSVENIKTEQEVSVPENKEKVEERPCEILKEEPVQSMEGSSEKELIDEKTVSNPDETKEVTEIVIDNREKTKPVSGRSKKLPHEKAEDTVSAPLTRNSIREKGVKLEETPLVVKKPTKDIPSTPSRRSMTRAGATDETKIESKSAGEIPLSSNKVYGTGLRKTTPKVVEAHTPNLRSRRGPTPTPMASSGEDNSKSASGRTTAIKKEVDVVEAEGKSKEKVDSDAFSSQKEVIILERDRLSPRKITAEKEKVKEILVKSEDDSNGEQSDLPGDEDGRAISGLDDESSDKEEMLKKKRFKASPRKERSESGEMADDDNSNSAFDGNQKKRLTRRSAKVSSQKSDGKSAENSADGNSSKDPETSSGKDNKARQSKTMSRLKNLNEEAQQIFGEIEVKEEDGNGKRITRARAKTSTSPGAKAKSSGSSKASTNNNNSAEHEASSEAEQGPSRATRSRAAASTSGGGISHSVIDSMPSAAALDSNPSSPSSSTTNSITIDEDRDQRAFRKSMMLIWNQIAAHKSASVFMKPITDEAVPGYSKRVKRPMDLLTIKRNIETGTIKTAMTLERDLYLMFLNAIMFNPRTHSIATMAKDMENDTAAILEEYKHTQKLLLKTSQENEGSNKKEGSDMDQEPQEEEKPKTATAKAAGRKRRNRSTSVGNSDEPVEGKRRTLRTSTTAATTAASAWQGSRKGKHHHLSPDIVSSGRME